MKMKKQDYDKLEQWIKPHLTGWLFHCYEVGNFSRSEKTKDWRKRLRWDLFSSFVPHAFVEKLYEYLEDIHIDTALKKIVRISRGESNG